MNALKETLPGVIAVFLITSVSLMISFIHPSFDVLVISIMIGMLTANLTRDREMFENGINFTLKIFLPVGIALYGTQLSFAVSEWKIWISAIVLFLTIFSLTYFIARGIGIKKDLGLLLSTGLSVCGASAIAVVSPLVKPRKEEISISVIVVMLFGLAGMIFYPIISDILVLSRYEFAFITGATLPMLGQVKATATAAGPDILAIALKIKLIRISCLIFLPIVIVLISGKVKKFYIPWFIIVFVALAILTNSIERIKAFRETAEPVSKFFLSSGLSAIGLSVDFDSIAEEGVKPLLGVFLSMGIVVLMLYLIMSLGNV